ncbi:hypothetical protein GCM10010517_58180 [Streptosporangium fragile]|uniref:Uncharacterized protein n=1 Tax=Streptosporangium fragile TaxID=46186 RepID=A0ABN3W643_9ACTN
MINVEASRLREPAAWLMVAVASTSVLVGIERLLFGTSSFGRASVAYLGQFASPVIPALLVGAVLLATHLGPVIERLKLMALVAVGTLGLTLLFGVIGLLGGLFGGAPGFLGKVELLVLHLPALALSALALLYLLPRALSAGDPFAADDSGRSGSRSREQYSQPDAHVPGQGQVPPQGQGPHDQAPHGQAPQGQAPFHGQAPQGQVPFHGQAPHDQAPHGQVPQGGHPREAVPAPAVQVPQNLPALPPAPAHSSGGGSEGYGRQTDTHPQAPSYAPPADSQPYGAQPGPYPGSQQAPQQNLPQVSPQPVPQAQPAAPAPAPTPAPTETYTPSPYVPADVQPSATPYNPPIAGYDPLSYGGAASQQGEQVSGYGQTEPRLPSYGQPSDAGSSGFGQPEGQGFGQQADPPASGAGGRHSDGQQSSYGGRPESQAPSYGGRPESQAPSYGQEQVPSYGQEQVPSYGQAQAPAYGQAQAPAYGQPGESQVPSYGQPQESSPYGQSQPPSYGQPQEPAAGYGQHSNPALPGYGQYSDSPLPGYGQQADPPASGAGGRHSDGQQPSYGGRPEEPVPSYGQEQVPSYGGAASQQGEQVSGYGQTEPRLPSYGQPSDAGSSGFGQPEGQGFGQQPSYGGPESQAPAYGQPGESQVPSYGQPQEQPPAYGRPAEQQAPASYPPADGNRSTPFDDRPQQSFPQPPENYGQPSTGYSGAEFGRPTEPNLHYPAPDPIDPRAQQMAQAYQQAESYQQQNQGTEPSLRVPEYGSAQPGAAYDDPFGHPQTPQAPPPAQPYQQGGHQWDAQGEATIRFDPNAYQADPLGASAPPAGRTWDSQPIDPTAIYKPEQRPGQVTGEETPDRERVGPGQDPNMSWYGSDRRER